LTRHALVTGASSGLGRAIAIELARRGLHVHLVARRAERLDEVAARIRAGGGSATCRVADVTDRAALRAAVAAAEGHAGVALDVLVANAGVAENGLGETPAAERAARVLDLNLRAAVDTIEAAAPAMVARGRGTVAAVTSLAGVRGLPGAASYCASKAGLSAYLESRALDLHASGVRVVDVRPGFVRTPMTDRNRFRMPFLMEPEAAARRAVAGILAGRRVVAFPRRLALPLALAAAALPHGLWRRVTR